MNREIYLRDVDRAIQALPDVQKLRSARILITGATGLVGAFLTDCLLALSDQNALDLRLYALCRNAARAKERFGERVNAIAADVSEATALPECDYIIHAASNAHPKAFSADPVGTMLANILGVRNLLEHLRAQGHGRLLFVSTGEIYGDNPAIRDGFAETDFGKIDSMNPRACYPESKRAAETLCASYLSQYRVDSVVARLCYVYGPTITNENSRADAQFLRNALSKTDIIMKSAGAQVRSYCYVADAARALIAILSGGESGSAYNVANRAAVRSIREYAEALAKVAGVQVKFETPEDAEKRGYSTVSRAVQKPDRLEALGWKPLFSFEEGIEHTFRIIEEA
ncbi:MAG: NAD-dependent epimerase/dehydratase family protein [Clostridia bacterium]|nr:NAD-dependent epimerase/dehydratase family protein [Clostridia bacterium]